MKRIYVTTVLALLFTAGYSQTKNFIDQPYLEVTGNADTLVTPNEIFIKIIISEKDTKDRVSVEELELKMYNALKALSIDVDRNLTTSDMASNFKYYLLKSKDVLKSKQYMLKVATANMAGKVFVELEKLDIANVSIDHVDHSGLADIKNKVITSAVINAKAKAQSLTEPLQQTVGAAIHIAYYDNQVVYNQYPEMVMNTAYAMKSRAADAEQPQIDFEKIKIVANVNVKFGLK